MVLLITLFKNARIRFVPNANWNGTSTFKYRAWDNKSAGLQLDGDDDYVSVSGVGKYSAITIECWIRMDSFSTEENGFNVIMNADKFDVNGKVHLQFRRYGGQTVLEMDEKTGSIENYVKFYYPFEEIKGKWTHIAVTANRDTGLHKLYVNGRSYLYWLVQGSSRYKRVEL